MQKAAKILLLIGFIFSIFSVVTVAILTIVLFAMSGQKDVIIQGLQDGSITTSFVGTVEQQADAICRSLSLAGTVLAIFLVIEIAYSVVTFVTMKKGTTGWYVASLVLSILGGGILILIGSILGLVSNTENKQIAE